MVLLQGHPNVRKKICKERSVNDCPNCEYYRKRAQLWREEAYRQAGHPLPEREWVGLTDEEIEGAIDDGFAFGLNDGNVSNDYVIRYVRVIEAKLKEKNG